MNLIIYLVFIKTKKKRKKLKTENALYGLWAGMVKNYCHICNQHLPTGLAAKFLATSRISEFETKNALFECFGEQF